MKSLKKLTRLWKPELKQEGGRENKLSSPMFSAEKQYLVFGSAEINQAGKAPAITMNWVMMHISLLI